jgi:hypothetical protein
MNDTGHPFAAEAALRQVVARVQRLHSERASDPIRSEALRRLADWQSRRLASTYADLAAQPRYAPAIAFFESDLYGGSDFSRRDTDLARVVPLLVRMLPERVIATIADAMELNALSQDLDRVVLMHLPRADGRFTVAEYCRAFRHADNLPARRRQIALTIEIGRALDHYVQKPLIRGALTMMRRPAHVAGFGALQDFLERGFNAFHRMRGADHFLATIEMREAALIDAIFAGRNDPFPDPFGWTVPSDVDAGTEAEAK